MVRSILVGMLVVGLLVASTASAQVFTMLNFSGFMYEEDNTPGMQGFPPSDPGDVCTGVGFIESIGPELDWDLAANQVTFVFSDLVSVGEVDLGGILYIEYTGGFLDIVADAIGDPAFTDAMYGTDPPNAMAPSTFWDGEVYLHGEFTSFYMTYSPTLHTGSYEGVLNWTGGTQLDELYYGSEGYTIAGTVDPFGALVPEGYDLEQVGHITLDATIPVKETTWGDVKNLYR